SDGDRFLAGQVATVNVLSEHRDLARTACPGDLLHGHLGLVRARMAALGYAHALFRTFVGRSPTDAERVDLASRVGSSGRFGAALQLSRSEAWAGAMVDRLYADVLGRPADAAGRRFWLQQLVAGTRFEHVAIQLYGSPEYFA